MKPLTSNQNRTKQSQNVRFGVNMTHGLNYKLHDRENTNKRKQ